MVIFQYSKEIQKAIGSTINPEPWLHVGIWKAEELTVSGNNMTTNPSYAIFVWDTREIVDYAFSKRGLKVKNIKGKPASDNKQPLKGSMSSSFNETMNKPKAEQQERKNHKDITIADVVKIADNFVSGGNATQKMKDSIGASVQGNKLGGINVHWGGRLGNWWTDILQKVAKELGVQLKVTNQFIYID